MSNEELKKYQASYNVLVDSLVKLHNANLHFCEHPENIRDRIEVRRQIKEIRNSLTYMLAQAKLVYNEGKKNYKEQQRNLKLQAKKARRPYNKKGKQNDNNQSTSGSV